MRSPSFSIPFVCFFTNWVMGDALHVETLERCEQANLGIFSEDPKTRLGTALKKICHQQLFHQICDQPDPGLTGSMSYPYSSPQTLLLPFGRRESPSSPRKSKRMGNAVGLDTYKGTATSSLYLYLSLSLSLCLCSNR